MISTATITKFELILGKIHQGNSSESGDEENDQEIDNSALEDIALAEIFDEWEQ